MNGSRISSTCVGSGSSLGESMRLIVPSVILISYVTVGAVCTISMLNSRSRRSWMISMCSRPRNPQRKPKLQAAHQPVFLPGLRQAVPAVRLRARGQVRRHA